MAADASVEARIQNQQSEFIQQSELRHIQHRAHLVKPVRDQESVLSHNAVGIAYLQAFLAEGYRIPSLVHVFADQREDIGERKRMVNLILRIAVGIFGQLELGFAFAQIEDAEIFDMGMDMEYLGW